MGRPAYNGCQVAVKLELPKLNLCLDELEREFLRVGREKCNRLEDRSQLSAFFRLGVRAVSLLRGMGCLLELRTLDSFQSVHRAFFETWQLQFEFRLADSSDKVVGWFHGHNDSWTPNLKKVAAEIQRLGRGRPLFGREWGELSELTHPTVDATTNSCAVATVRHGFSNVAQEVEAALEVESKNYKTLLMQEIWLVDAQDPSFLALHISWDKLQKCKELYDEFIASHQS